ncbi:MAG: hypothetical protein S4CHLAM45_01850 [Chlamydiales bacterium]|nr:hypothetical protein [Chlamydiales bacterium]MCH9619504.1 hypothetical protein [Chlamydiales bacterium]MCH9622308.1 hypothetical protein [Chlamydiales bacterium]
MKEGSIYLITHYALNHDKNRYDWVEPIDPRFLNSKNNYTYYLIDNEIPESLKGKNCILENSFDPLVKKGGKHHLSEWSTFLAERKYRFATYPMFIISSRFYEKNRFLQKSLDKLWEPLFQGLDQFGYAMLSSYDRPLRWMYPKYKDTHPKYQKRFAFYPLKRKSFELIEQLYGINIEKDFPHYTDFCCDYFGFKSYEHFAKYLDFYTPIIDHFLTKDFELKVDLNDYFYVGCSDHRTEKPITYILECFSHLFFALEKQSFFACHHTGLFEIQTFEKKKIPIERFTVPFLKRCIRRFNWMRQWISLQSAWPQPLQRIALLPFQLFRILIKKTKIRSLLPTE